MATKIDYGRGRSKTIKHRRNKVRKRLSYRHVSLVIHSFAVLNDLATAAWLTGTLPRLVGGTFFLWRTASVRVQTAVVDLLFGY